MISTFCTVRIPFSFSVTVLVCSLTWISSGCGPRAVREKAAPIQAKHNLIQIRLAIINYWDDHGKLPTSDERINWRVVLAPYLEDSWKAGKGNAMPCVFRIPTTCSQSAINQTNVFLFRPTDLVVPNHKMSWETFERKHPAILLFIVVDNACEDWMEPGILENNETGATFTNQQGADGRQNARCTIVRVNGDIQQFDSVVEALTIQERAE